MSGLLETALRRIDELNAGDPNTVVEGGKERPRELAYSEWMTRWVRQLEPQASQALLLAARGHHCMRWKMPRSDYDKGTTGYYLWKTTARQFHVETIGEILTEAGYDRETVEDVQHLVGRTHPDDPRVQVLQDAVSLTFLEYQFEDFIRNNPPDTVIRTLRGTIAKMSGRAQQLALGITYSDECRKFLDHALKDGDA